MAQDVLSEAKTAELIAREAINQQLEDPNVGTAPQPLGCKNPGPDVPIVPAPVYDCIDLEREKAHLNNLFERRESLVIRLRNLMTFQSQSTMAAGGPIDQLTKELVSIEVDIAVFCNVYVRLRSGK